MGWTPIPLFLHTSAYSICLSDTPSTHPPNPNPNPNPPIMSKYPWVSKTHGQALMNFGMCVFEKSWEVDRGSLFRVRTLRVLIGRPHLAAALRDWSCSRYVPPSIREGQKFRKANLPRRLRDSSQPTGFRLARPGEKACTPWIIVRKMDSMDCSS